MLQQTQSARVVGPYRRFLRHFPTPRSCARAGVAEVVRAWSGLGYNRRAVNLHSCAAVIVDRYRGNVPDTLPELQALPGVGPYTARAVLAFAFEQPVGVVDVNVRRVLCRAVSGRTLSVAQAQRLADLLVPSAQSWLWNQVMVEHGATCCTARRPRCDDCRLSRQCAWVTSGSPLLDPGASVSRQSRFEGSDRQGRGRLLAALRAGPVRPPALAMACGWPDDDERAHGAANSLVEDGLARRDRGGTLRLP